MLSSLIISLVALSSLNSTASIRDYTISRAMDNHVSVALAISIIQAESNFNINAKNASSTASGLAQFTNGTFKILCIDKYKLADSMTYKNDPRVQIECLVRRLSEPNGVKEWQASKSIWEKNTEPLRVT